METITEWKKPFNSFFFCEKCFERSGKKSKQNPVTGNTVCIFHIDDGVSNAIHYAWHYLFKILNNKPEDIIVGITPHIFIPIKYYHFKGELISILCNVSCGVCSVHKTINSLGNTEYVFDSRNKFVLKIKSENWESLYINRIKLSDS